VGKLATAASRLLAEVCRPLHMAPHPQLRGFYFVGARPVLVADAAPLGAVAQAAASAVAAGATTAFARPASAAAPAAPVVGAGAAYGPPTTRKVPQWTFLDRLFPEVILADRGAAAAARGGVRVARLRRGLLAGGIAAACVAAIFVGVSWRNNQRLAARTTAAAQAVAALPTVSAPPGGVAFPSVPALAALDSLRSVLEELRARDRDGVPLRYGSGCGRATGCWRAPVWCGSPATAAAARRLPGRRCATRCARSPTRRAPTDDYARTYAALRAYLVTTAEPTRSTPEFLAPCSSRAGSAGRRPTPRPRRSPGGSSSSTPASSPPARRGRRKPTGAWWPARAASSAASPAPSGSTSTCSPRRRAARRRRACWSSRRRRRRC
jgi:type VI secretion system protein ImpL